MNENEDLILKPEACLHMLEDIDRLAESGNSHAILCRALIKAELVEIFDAYNILFEMGLVTTENIDKWGTPDGD